MVDFYNFHNFSLLLILSKQNMRMLISELRIIALYIHLRNIILVDIHYHIAINVKML